MGLWTPQKGAADMAGRYCRRDADGGGRDDRATEEVANDWGDAVQPRPKGNAPPAAGLERFNKSRSRDFQIYHARIESRNAGMVNSIPSFVEQNARGEGLQAGSDLYCSLLPA